MRFTLHDAAALLRPKCRPFRLTPSALQSTYPALYDATLLARRVILSARRAVFIDWRLLGACPQVQNYSLAVYAAHPHLSAKFNHELRYKNQKPSNKAPDKILRRKIKIGLHKLAQKPDLKAKFYARLFKKSGYLAINL